MKLIPVINLLQIPQPTQQMSSLDQWKTEIQIQKQDILCKKFAGELRAALFGTVQEQRDTIQINEHSKNQEQGNYQMLQNGKERCTLPYTPLTYSKADFFLSHVVQPQDSHQMEIVSSSTTAEMVYELPPVSFPSSPFPIPNPEAFLATYFNVQFVNNTP